MNAQVEEHHYGFVIGLAAGTLVGAGLALWLVPRAAAEVRQQASDTVKGLRKRASDQYQQASTRVGDAVEELARKTDDVRDGVADAVVHGAHEVERLAMAVKSDRRR